MVKSTLEFPKIYLLDAHISTERLLELEDEIPNLTYDINEAEVVLGKVTTKQRAQFELRKRNVYTSEVNGKDQQNENKIAVNQHDVTTRKRRKVESSPGQVEVIDLESTAESEGETLDLPHKVVATLNNSTSRCHTKDDDVRAKTPDDQATPGHNLTTSFGYNVVKVVKLSWFSDSLEAGQLLPFTSYLVYQGKIIPKPELMPTTKV